MHRFIIWIGQFPREAEVQFGASYGLWPSCHIEFPAVKLRSQLEAGSIRLLEESESEGYVEASDVYRATEQQYLHDFVIHHILAGLNPHEILGIVSSDKNDESLRSLLEDAISAYESLSGIRFFYGNWNGICWNANFPPVAERELTDAEQEEEIQAALEALEEINDF